MKKVLVMMLALVLSSSAVIASEKGSMAGSMNEEAMSGVSTYDIDASHSTLGFAVKHLQVGTTRGSFNVYDGKILLNDGDFDSFAAEVSIDATSINTNNDGRDKHLRSPDFFDTENHPKIKFSSHQLEKRGEGAVIIGDLTIKGITKTLTIPVSVVGPVDGMKGGKVIGIAGYTTINRQDFDISWSKQLDSGGLVVGDMVDLTIEIEAHQK